MKERHCVGFSYFESPTAGPLCCLSPDLHNEEHKEICGDDKKYSDAGLSDETT
jgi:hypothetical protein